MGQGRGTSGREFGLGLRAEASVRGPGKGSWIGDEDLGYGVEREAAYKKDAEVRATLQLGGRH